MNKRSFVDDAAPFLGGKLRIENARGVAKYAQLADALRKAIQRGDLPPGTRLPNEQQLALELPLSLGTIQHALRTLVAEGLLVRRAGQGTFVAERRSALANPWHCRFLADDGVTVLDIFPRTLAREVLQDDGPWTRWIGKPRNGALMIARAFDVAGEFTVVSRFYGDCDRLAPLLAIPAASLDGLNLKTVIADRCAISITQVEHRLSLGTVPNDVRELLGPGKTAKAQILDAVAYAGATAIYFQRFYIPPNDRMLLFAERSR